MLTMLQLQATYHPFDIGGTTYLLMAPFGYFANSSRTWLVTKESHMARAREIFCDTQVKITSQGRPHLVAPLGSKEYAD